MTLEIGIFDQKYAQFGDFDVSYLTILKVQKVVFWKFSKMFRNF